MKIKMTNIYSEAQLRQMKEEMVAVHLTKGERRILTALAKSKGISVSKLVRDAVRSVYGYELPKRELKLCKNPRCKKGYNSERITGQYCSSACGQYIRTKRHRAKKKLMKMANQKKEASRNI